MVEGRLPRRNTAVIERTRAWRRRQARLMIVKVRRSQQWVQAQVEKRRQTAEERRARAVPARGLRLKSLVDTDLADAQT